MILSDEQLNLLEQYASVFFSNKEIALLLKVNVDEFMEVARNKNSNIYKIIQSARLTSEFEIRQEIVKMAKMGSPAAQTETLKIIANNNLNNI